MLTLTAWLRKGFVRFLPCKVSLSPLFYTVPLGGSHSVQFRLQMWGVFAPFPGGQHIYMNYLEFFSRRELYFPPSVLTHSIIDLYQYELKYIYFILWVISQKYFIYFFPQIVPSFAIRSSFIWLLCPFDILHHCVCVLKYFLTSWHHKVSRLTLYISWSSPRISYFPKESWFPWLEDDSRHHWMIWSLLLGCCYC